jgi:hypothetical protein
LTLFLNILLNIFGPSSRKASQRTAITVLR